MEARINHLSWGALSLSLSLSLFLTRSFVPVPINGGYKALIADIVEGEAGWLPRKNDLNAGKNKESLDPPTPLPPMNFPDLF